MAAEAELFDGTILEFPDGTPPDVIARVAKQQTTERQTRVGSPAMDAVTPRAAPVVTAPVAVPAPAPQRGMMDAILDTGVSLAQDGLGLLGHAGRGARRGVSMLAGAPVDIVNNAPRLFGGNAITPNPIGGADSIDTALGGFGLIPDLKPTTTAQGVAQRVGQEIGASALPAAAVVAKGASMGAQAARAMQTTAPAIAPASSIPGAQAANQIINNAGNAVRNVAGAALEAGAVAPGATLGREIAYGTAAGAGAGLANVAAGNPQSGDNFWSDFGGSVGGAGALGITSGVLRQGGGLVNAIAGRPMFRNNVAEEEVVARILANSTDAANQAANSPRGAAGIDTTPLASKLRQPSQAEVEIPGFRANIADRVQDPALSTYAYNAEAAAPGAASARRTGNEAAISDTMESIAPVGDPAQFRAALEADRVARIGAAEDRALARQGEFETAAQTAQPTLPDATQRGVAVREALAERYAQEQDRVRQAYQPIDEANIQVDAAPLAQRFDEITAALPLNDRQRFLPAEARVPQQLVSPATPDAPSSILDPTGTPFVRPGAPASGTVPLNEITALRSGLTDDIRVANAAGEARRAGVAQGFRAPIDEYMDAILPGDLKAQLDTARATRRDVADRFERSGTAIENTLRAREGGGYALDDSAVPGRFAPTDQGRVNDFQAAMREAGTNPRLRGALADEVLADVNRRGLTQNPAELRRYMGERNIMLEAFPELRDRLGGVASARENAIIARETADATNRRLTTPSQSPEAAYLKFDDARTVDAVRSVTASAEPGRAARTLIEAAGDTPEALRNGRAALWEVVKQQKMAAPGVTGGERWNGRKIKAMFDDPKTSAVAKELWRDAPDELDAIKRVGEALAAAEGSSRARVPGSSGTAQQLRQGFDARSISSSIRSVNQGRSSMIGEFLYQAQGILRNRSVNMQRGVIDRLENEVINTPGLAADLLEKFNPADFAAKKRMLTQKYGVRATQFLNVLDENDDVKDAITRKPGAN